MIFFFDHQKPLRMDSAIAMVNWLLCRASEYTFYRYLLTENNDEVFRFLNNKYPRYYKLIFDKNHRGQFFHIVTYKCMQDNTSYWSLSYGRPYDCGKTQSISDIK
jgi:hypothetical protein